MRHLLEEELRKLLSALLYTGFVLTANSASAESLSEQLGPLKTGDMRKLALHAAPKPVDLAGITLESPQGAVKLDQYRGKFVVLNFWALWCAPCREEMPTLDALNRDFGGDDFAVVTVATGPNNPIAIDKFFDEIGVETLPRYRDPKSQMARKAAVIGLPVTLVLNTQGQEIGRLTGTADWNSDAARAMVEMLILSAQKG